ncbi:MAG: thioredoxin domain-containing protein [Actinomycetota bacterium]|nr:thioredoxin domain-containing protein [Actinomycetota bacterium]
MPNRLADSTSPYLLQHQDNPVDWFEWGEEAFELASATDRPILLSVGYSACHWCHVMAHESFEDNETAGYMNEYFINIKVDREERPDVDRIYMDALQAISGQGGWPMTVFLTPDGEPFFAGTYFPKEPHGHMPSFRQLLENVVGAWHTKRDELTDQAGRLTAAVRAGLPAAQPPSVRDAAATAVQMLTASHDPEWGGFGRAPKFPQAPVLEFLLRSLVLTPSSRPTIEPMLRRTLDAMRAGGIYDQIGGGFARYSVDGRWLIPHFEKMLYDNALLARIYLRAGQALDEPRYIETARETLDYLTTEMRDPSGGIHAAEDADSEGVEGKFYVWSQKEFQQAAGADTDLIATLYGVTARGNFEGANNLHLASSLSEAAARHNFTESDVIEAKARVDKSLLSMRAGRVRPGRDDKVIASWNGLALRAFAEAAAVLNSPEYLDVAVGIAEFVTTNMVREDGRLFRAWRRGRTSGPAFCDDYGAMAVGLFTLFQVTADTRWYSEAERLTRAMIDLFSDDDGFFTTGADADDLIARPKDFADNPLPSSNSLAAEALLIMAAYTGATDVHVAGITRGAARLLEQHPSAVGHLLGVLITAGAGFKEVAIVGPADQRRSFEEVLWQDYRPECILAVGDGEGPIPLLKDRGTAGTTVAAHVCRNFVCDLPVTTPEALRNQLDA